MAKAKAIKATRAEILAARDMQLRGECVATAGAYATTKSIDDVLRGAQKYYDWMKGGPAPEVKVPDSEAAQ